MSVRDLFRSLCRGTGKKLSVLDGFVDYHSHILPGVDDGVESLDETLAILSEFERRGCREVWFTPHIMEEIPNKTSDLRRVFDNVLDSYAGNMKLHLASENMLDSLYAERLDANDLLPMDSGWLLVETSYYDSPANFTELLEKTVDMGYKPLLAHPERYNYMDESSYRRLKDMGVGFQLNIVSLGRYYGDIARDKARWLIEHGMYNRAGTDIHRIAALDVIDRISDSKKCRELLMSLP